MRIRYQWLAAMALATLAATGAQAETAPAPGPQAYPAGYLNPFDPNWWLATFNNMMRLYTVPAAYPAPTVAPQPAQANAVDPNRLLAVQPSAAGPAMGSAYVTTQTPYGPVPVFNYADPAAWNKLFAQPFAAPGQ